LSKLQLFQNAIIFSFILQQGKRISNPIDMLVLSVTQIPKSSPKRWTSAPAPSANIYRKLNVQSRAEAVATALDRLGLLQQH
jgi:hypothetical protein